MSLSVILVLMITKLSVCAACHSFKDTNMTVVSRAGERFHTSVTGCIERKSFETTISEIYVKEQPLPRLERDAVRHMVRLTTLSFENCSIQTIEPALFRNMFSLRFLHFVHNDLSEIKSGIFSTLPRLEVLKLNNNNIATIQNFAFGNLTTLKEVRLGHNRLDKWTEEWLGNSSNIEVMDFQFNKIKILPRRAFVNFRQLREVIFDYNELELINPEVFEGITSLDYLGLRYNKLKVIDWRSFPNRMTIKKFFIGANLLNYLSMRVRRKIVVKELNVQGNPLKCPCMDQIYFWLHETNATVTIMNTCKGGNIPVCCFPSSYSYTCRETVDEEVTRTYLGNLKAMDPPLDQHCARLD